jgi:hypothetical protein
MNRLDTQARALLDLVRSVDTPPVGAKVVTWERIASRLVFAPDPDMLSGPKPRS